MEVGKEKNLNLETKRCSLITSMNYNLNSYEIQMFILTPIHHN